MPSGEQSHRRGRDVIRFAAAALAYAAITTVIGRRVLATVGSAIASDPGDPILNAAILAWNATHRPWTDAWYQFPIFFPTPDALTLSEHLLGVSLLASPIVWLTDNPLVAYNASLLLSYPLCGMAMYALVLHLTRSGAAAFLAGLAFAFAPYRASQLPHIQVLFVFWAPLALLALHRFADSVRVKPDPLSVRLKPDTTARRLRLQADRRWQWLAMFGVCWLLQASANGYFLVYFSVLVGLWLLWFLVARGRGRDALRVVGAMGVAALPLAPILYRYLIAQRSLGLSRNLGEIASFGADIAAPLCAPATLTFWGWLRVACAQEGELFPGAALIAISVAGGVLLYEPRRRRDAEAFNRHRSPRLRASVVRISLAVALVFIAIALSTVLVGPWRIAAGPFRLSASSFDKPLSTALALLLVAWLSSDHFRQTVQRGSTTAFYALAALACWVLSWGPFPRLFGAEALYQAPFAWLLQIPGVSGLRVPARFWMMTVICLVIVMGFAFAAIVAGVGPRLRAAVAAVAACALLTDGWMTIPVAPVRIAAASPPPGSVVVAMPPGDPERDTAAVYAAVRGGWRAVNGFSGYEPGYYEALRTLAQANDPVLFVPFVTRADLHVVTAAGASTLTRRPPAVRPPAALGARLGIAAVAATCGSAETSRAVDGNHDTRWVCGPQIADEQITLDLGTAQTVAAVVHALGTNGADFPRHLIIETSEDGTAWQAAWQGSPAREVLFAAMEAPRRTRAVLTFTPRPARYVRLRQTGRHEVNYWSIAELEVWTGR